jgi:pimeloyl-ACP methyl ester carboxylesterase
LEIAARFYAVFAFPPGGLDKCLARDATVDSLWDLGAGSQKLGLSRFSGDSSSSNTMPFVDLNSGDDYASIWYMTNSPFGNVGGFCPEKPTVVLLHPMFLDSSWLHYQFSDRRLNSEFNLIAVDMRVCGKSASRPSGRHDSWVEAADLARVHCVSSMHFVTSLVERY